MEVGSVWSTVGAFHMPLQGGHTFDLTAPDTPIFESLEEEAVVMQEAIANVDTLTVRLVKVVTGCEDERTYLDLPDSLPPVAGMVNLTLQCSG